MTVTFRGADGTGDSVVGHSTLPTIPSDGRSPFVVRLENRSARPASVDVDVTFEEGADRPYGGLAVVDHRETERTQSQVTVAGRVENRGDERVATHVVATFYDGDGAVVGVRSVPTSPRVLAPGDAGGFELRLRTLGNVPSRASDVERYELVLRAERAEVEDAGNGGGDG